MRIITLQHLSFAETEKAATRRQRKQETQRVQVLIPNALFFNCSFGILSSILRSQERFLSQSVHMYWSLEYMKPSHVLETWIYESISCVYYV